MCTFPGCEKGYTDGSSLRKHVKGVHGGAYKSRQQHSHYDQGEGQIM